MASGKQKRTNQNRQQRSALQARKAAASKPVSSGSAAAGGGAGGGLLGRLRGAMAPTPRAARPAGARAGAARTAAAPAGDGGDPLTRNGQPVGYRAAMTGLIAAIAAVGVSFIVSTPITQDGDPYTTERVVAEWADTALVTAQETGGDAEAVVEEIGEDWMPQRDTDRLAIVAFPASLAMALPVIGAYFAFRAVQRRSGSRVVNRAMYATLFGAVLTFGLLTFFLPTVIAVGVAGFQVRKAETAAAMAAAPAGGDEDDDVIEADVVEDEVDDDVIEADVDDDTGDDAPPK